MVTAADKTLVNAKAIIPFVSLMPVTAFTFLISPEWMLISLMASPTTTR